MLPERLDEPENLVLLCRVHHKMVDDQHETYTADVLRALKASHQRWVSSSLTEDRSRPRLRIRRIRGNIPSHLMRLTSGREIMAVVEGAHSFSFDHEEPRSEAEVDLLSQFLQEAQDWGDLSGELEAGDRVRASHRLSTFLGISISQRAACGRTRFGDDVGISRSAPDFEIDRVQDLLVLIDQCQGVFAGMGTPELNRFGRTDPLPV